MRFYLVGLLLFSQTGFAIPGFPDGKYVGSGLMKEGTAEEEVYQSELIIINNTLSATYTYPGGHVVKFEARLTLQENGEYKVHSFQHGDLGTAHCLDGMCHLKIPAHKAEETLICRGNKIYRFGTMEHPNAMLVYSETVEQP